jgi:hypothetical protein
MKATNTLSIRMMHTLRKGKDRLGREAQERVRQYIVSQMTERAFFMDKSGREDIYYTAFGLMLSYIFGVGMDTKEVRLRLETRYAGSGDLIHYAAFIRSLMIVELLEGKRLVMLLARLLPAGKTGMPVFTAFPHNDCRSPYSRFIRLSLMEDMRRRIDKPEEIIESLEEYKVQDSGGYSNRAGGLSASTNATAAALSVKGQLAGYGRREDAACLYDWQDDSGGFYATRQTPLPDMLSTATALFVLRCYGVRPRIRPDDFIEAHWLESGGFSPTLPEESSDMEYTFYGILALGTC